MGSRWRCGLTGIGLTVLVSCPGDGFTKSVDLVQDRIGRGGPDERVTAAVIVLHESLDLDDQVVDAAEGAAPDRALGDDAEPDLHLIEP